MVLIEDSKVINLNPTFVLWNKSINFIVDNYSIIIITILEIAIAAFLLFFFFQQEMIFIYNYIFGMVKTNEDLENYEYYRNKIYNLKNAKLFCNNDILYYEINNITAPVIALNGDQITDCSKIITS